MTLSSSFDPYKIQRLNLVKGQTHYYSMITTSQALASEWDPEMILMSIQVHGGEDDLSGVWLLFLWGFMGHNRHFELGSSVTFVKWG